eukprot:355948_1
MLLKLEEKTPLVEVIWNKTPRTGFIIPKSDDYICSEITNCNTIKRIVHLCNHFKSALTDNKTNILPIYEYISSLSNYNVAQFMEDWYHSKTAHFKTENDYKHIQNNIHTDCLNNIDTECNALGRHGRQKGREMYVAQQSIDHKNIILRDQLDSIHTFIFHSNSSQRFKSDDRAILSSDNVEEVENLATSIAECTLKQILVILNHEQVFGKLNKLFDYKNNIIQFFKENKFDGPSLTKLNRKQFMNKIADDLGNKKLKQQLAMLYTNIMRFELKSFDNKNVAEPEGNRQNTEKSITNDIWSNTPKSVTQCNAAQILYILNNNSIVENLAKLSKHKSDIINYVTQNQMDGVSLSQLGRKTFIMVISEYCNDKQMRGQLGTLYSKIMKYDIRKYTHESQHEQRHNLTEPAEPIILNSGKFQTSMGVSDDQTKTSYYSFGTQYKYTNNLKEHPLFVKPKYHSFKQELVEYFKRLNET